MTTETTTRVLTEFGFGSAEPAGNSTIDCIVKLDKPIHHTLDAHLMRWGTEAIPWPTTLRAIVRKDEQGQHISRTECALDVFRTQNCHAGDLLIEFTAERREVLLSRGVGSLLVFSSWLGAFGQCVYQEFGTQREARRYYQQLRRLEHTSGRIMLVGLIKAEQDGEGVLLELAVITADGIVFDLR